MNFWLPESMKYEFEMSIVGKLNFFLGFQVQQHETGIFLSQEKYARNLIKNLNLSKPKLNELLLPLILRFPKTLLVKR